MLAAEEQAPAPEILLISFHSSMLHSPGRDGSMQLEYAKRPLANGNQL
jgi:hypothetical protein